MKKRLRVRVVSLVLAMTLLLSSAGCGNNTSSDGKISSASNEVETIEATADITNTLNEAKKAEEAAKKAEEAARRQEEAAKKAEEAAKKAEEEAIKAKEEAKAEAERIKAEEEAKKAEDERIKAEEEAKKAEEERIKAEEEAKRAEEERIKAEAEAKRVEEEKKRKEEEAKKAEEARKVAEAQAKRDREIKNSFSMMYYLAFTAENIRASKNNRLILDDIYTSLLNDINPGTIDEITQDHLKNLRDIIKAYINISTKRERLQFIYNQNKAAAMRSAIPNPLAVLSMTHSLDWKKLAIATVYTVVDSYNNYKNASENADKEFLMSGWDLDDEELATVQKNRDRAFDYMVDMVQKYDLDGLKTFNEKDVAKFSEICSIESATEKIKRLTAEEEKYELFGNYWLELADCYFETDKYKECLKCIQKYNDLSTGIYRQDLNYVKVLPKAIVAAQNVYKGDEYVSTISDYADSIIKNTDKSVDDWSTRYFAAQVYLDLYAKTNKATYLDKAYNIAYDNVAILLQGQRNLNTTYINDVVEETVNEPDYRYLTKEKKKEKEKEYSDEKKRVKEYNKRLKEERKTELISLYEPLVLNCDLLFALAEKKGISQTEKKDIDLLLQSASNGIFYVGPINDAFSFSKRNPHYTIELSKDKIVIPANLLTSGAKLNITISDNNGKTVCDDYEIDSVKREGKTINEFFANVYSKKWKKNTWNGNSKITVTITYADAGNKEITLKYKVAEYEEHWYGDKVVFGEE